VPVRVRNFPLNRVRNAGQSNPDRSLTETWVGPGRISTAFDGFEAGDRMYLSREIEPAGPVLQRRRFARVEIQCRARIRIGTRQYAGYIHNISRGGAKLRTISPIRKLGAVILRLPDLPPLSCRLRWTDAYHAGVMFEIPIPAAEFRQWAKTRSALWQDEWAEADFVELAELDLRPA
jgi:hypothetical protein